MSSNLELVRSIFGAWERGDFRSVEWAHPDIEWVVVGGPEPGTWRGLAGMAAAWRGWLSAWEDFRGEGEGYRKLDDERVLVLYRFSARGKTSGLDAGKIQTLGASLFHVHVGKVTRLVFYVDRERAFADLGLKE
jgi:ketosteroid isomerase-like protein